MAMHDLGATVTLDFEITDAAGACVDPASADLTVVDPSEATTTPTLATVGTGLRRALIPLTTAGVWRWRLTTTNPDQTRDGVLVAAALYADLPWLPSITDVADYVPARTLAVDTPGTETYLGTFTADTTPTGAQVERLAATAASYVSARAGTVAASLYQLASAAAAARAAALVELAYPQRDDDLNTAEALTAQAV